MNEYTGNISEENRNKNRPTCIPALYCRCMLSMISTELLYTHLIFLSLDCLPVLDYFLITVHLYIILYELMIGPYALFVMITAAIYGKISLYM